MTSALSQIGGPPPAPNPNPENQSQSSSLSPMVAGAAGSALSQGIGSPASAQGQGQPGQPGQNLPPPPSNQQTVAALKHFTMIEREVRGLLADPECGKVDMKSMIIDGMTGLIGEGIVSAADAVRELGSLPERPIEQKQWLEQRMSQCVQASNLILQHHRMAFAGMPDEAAGPQYDASNHIPLMAGIAEQYSRAKNAGQ